MMMILDKRGREFVYCTYGGGREEGTDEPGVRGNFAVEFGQLDDGMQLQLIVVESAIKLGLQECVLKVNTIRENQPGADRALWRRHLLNFEDLQDRSTYGGGKLEARRMPGIAAKHTHLVRYRSGTRPRSHPL
jgi:hypothetical protein